MVHLAIPPPSQRLTLLAVAAVLHLGLLALLLSAGWLPPLAVKPLAAMTTMAMARDRGSARPPPALPSRLSQPQRVLREIQFSDQPDAIARDAAGGCAALPLIAQALVADPVALAAVRGAPPEIRSIADAVVLWNAGWAAAASTPDMPLAPARSVVEQSLLALPDNCLDEPVAGPRLVPVADGDRTMFVVIGSGNWTWRQLLDDSDPTPSLVPLSADRPAAALWPWL